MLSPLDGFTFVRFIEPRVSIQRERGDVYPNDPYQVSDHEAFVIPLYSMLLSSIFGSPIETAACVCFEAITPYKALLICGKRPFPLVLLLMIGNS
jgi:hypothetical protein